ncbi:hypothetical protein CLAFUW4_06882 [Fulvia fulva]|uniref:ubiquitinyl hydrolase 1 n=1 Tax=Passalora fulva TaxID=5499 RepID=A0A9Q8PAY2_PASFU|nr:uncharacterized protein CLAFUR5_07020 [Fulvia fulva]KAK4621589.1 hypothetical protein CLAFUR4_06890 [Fulvia fulva]KAK4622667.1 hypothetical protein CLAFUR0_06887 [Fulvia fulva]UJO19130.1 hypothetical protein CLAFUR5_07020 [Fulvia fulva]WPV16397.1 hypothetical protein CLAFUW4_06882 [Fulvia fulva]WPV31644.1 hypothetical protein CLAFUW7_06881 [Fulvia fulva]
MSGVHRFLSRREKKNPRHSSPHHTDKFGSDPPPPVNKPDHFGAVFTIEDDPKVKPDKEEEERKIQGVLERLRAYGVNTMVESNARYALRVVSPQGNGEEAFKLLMLLEDTYEGIVTPYSPPTKLLGAVNRENVTCYLDALLFAMFARLDSFEAMLYENFDDIPRKKLAGLLRLWVNMLRTGRLIATDITRHMQESLAACGWEGATQREQQDPSEAFGFITGKLELPLLTLKMDLHHAGKEDPQDDHKFINERLLEVAIPEEPVQGSNVITLEDCLEHYFNNRIEVKRHMENQRRSTLKSAEAGDSKDPYMWPAKVEKDSGLHVEVAEIGSASDTPLVQTPTAETPMTPVVTKDPLERVRPTAGRKRGDSIFSSRKILLEGIDPETGKVDNEGLPEIRERKMSTRTEVLMPAWQFFKLLPWYTDHMPTTDAQVAAHFSKKRPVLGICLKRYAFTNEGQSTRRSTYVDIPLEIQVPNFVSDENMQDEGPLVTNFRLLLQSVVCHRGHSTHSGHYVCLTRGSATNATDSRRSSSDSEDIEDPWMRFDDLARERVTYVDIRQALKDETPYLLFYQVQPIGDDGHSIHELPSYAEATSRSQSDLVPSEKPYLNEQLGSENALEQVPSNAMSTGDGVGSDSIDWAATTSGRPSLEISAALEDRRGRRSFQGDERRKSITFDTSSYAGSIRTDPTVSVPSTPADENPPTEKNGNSFLAVANMISSSRRGSKPLNGKSKSRPTSAGPDANGGRFSLNMTKLTQRMSRNSESHDKPPVPTPDHSAPPEEPPATTTVTESLPDDPVSTSDKNSVGHVEDASRESVDTVNAETKTLKPPPAANPAETKPLTKKEKEILKREKRKNKKHGEEDRDCVMM